MKRNNIIKGLAVFAAMAMLPACSSDYLDLKPEANPSEKDAFATVESAQLAVNGVCLSMMTQYQSTSWNQYNGDPYVNTLCNDAIGQDYISGLGGAWWGAETIQLKDMQDPSNMLNAIPWDYAYGLIQQTNKILDNIDGASGEEAERDFVKAEALTLRAYAYTKLLGYYAPRWENSNNGNTYCMVLRTNSEIQNVPLCTMNDVLNQVYEDLDNALALYETSGGARTMKFQPDASIARGVYARAALIKNDWKKAQEMAHAARQNYKIMDAKTYLAGFYADNDDFMWISSSTDSDIYYWSWGSHYAANGLYVKNWSLGAGAIDIDLYNQLDANDIRRKCYLTPDKIEDLVAFNRGWNPGRLTLEDWWNPDLVNVADNLDLSGGPAARQDAINGKWGMYNIAVYYSKYYMENVFTGTLTDVINKEEKNYAYYSIEDNGKVLVGLGEYAALWKIPFGAQFKFMSYVPYGTSCYSYMRASEMLLAEAEAAYHAGDIATAQSCLVELNSKRIEGYTCTLTGNALFNEIVKTRRIELWGEGQNFTDFKRWNLPIQRRAWVSGDATSGNWMPERVTNIATDFANGWMFTVPESEYNYNPMIDRTLLPSAE